jgi:hypothetical protein
MSWSISSNVPWLTVSQSLGSGAAVVEVSVDHSALVPGDYQGQLTIDGGSVTGNSPQVVPIFLTVLSGQNYIYLPISVK